MPETVNAVNTKGTILKYGATAATLTKLCAIKDYPDLGGAPELLETTDLEATMQTFINGIQSIGAMEFTSNYTKATYQAVKANENKPGYYALEFGDAGADGIFTWQGEHTVWVTGGSVNGVREMRISIAPSSKVELKTTT